jgi:hypothetical protein
LFEFLIFLGSFLISNSISSLRRYEPVGLLGLAIKIILVFYVNLSRIDLDNQQTYMYLTEENLRKTLLKNNFNK